jgi:DNA-directed RNA polymerase subunit K/omega
MSDNPLVEIPSDAPVEGVEPVEPFEPAEPITNRFLFVDVSAQRAKQLRRGARPRIDAAGAPHKLERVAMDEVRQGAIHYSVPPVRSTVAGGRV